VNRPPFLISLSFWVELVGACNSIARPHPSSQRGDNRDLDLQLPYVVRSPPLCKSPRLRTVHCMKHATSDDALSCAPPGDDARHTPLSKHLPTSCRKLMAPSATCRLRHPAPLCLQPPAAAAAATPGTLLVANRESLCVVLNREN
jgi:hypothetical protein